ncbi:MAG TPA: peptidoglycan endopeptidase [Sphingomonas sp.]|nr:peptidoglycan endopeptidase [Sphingomonas sp.]
MGQDEIVAAARACVGARFRLHGREPETGLDCVGLAAFAYAGRLKGAVPSGYALRGGDPETVAARIDALGLARADGQRAGDLLLLVSGPFQLHLAIRTERGFIHADAGLRRVVETPGEPQWPMAGAWRIASIQ